MRAVSFVVCLFLAASTLFAQSDRGTITGTISDPAGALVPNAPVEAKNAQTGAVYAAAATATGNYTIPELPPGTYGISVAVPGFKTYTRQGLTVQAAQTYRVDVKLEVGATSESVSVTAESPMLKTESGELSHNISDTNLDELPVLGIGSSFASNSGVRNPYAATNLIPGGIFGGDTVVRINGAPINTESFRVEGQESSNRTMPMFGSQNQPSVDSIQEFSVQTSNYSAEFGQAGGGIFIATMKSGSNAFHGTGYDYFVNEALNASTPFTNTKPRARRNDYGFTLGGPVWVPKIYDGHNKTFFFFNFEQFRENTVVNNVPLTVPTEAYRAGDFATAEDGRMAGTDPLGRPIMEGEIYDPNTARTVNGQVVTDPFPNNAIPASRLDPVALAIQNLIPSPNQAGLINNYLPSYLGIRHTTITSVKGDQLIGSKQKLSAFWSLTHTYSPYSQVVQGDGLPPEITDGRGNYDTVNTIRLNYDYTLTPTLLLHIGAGYVGQHGPDDYTPAMDSFDPASIGLKGTFKTGRFPYIAGGGPGRATGLCSGISGGISAPYMCNGQGGMQIMGPATSGGSPENIIRGGIYSFRPTANASLTWIRGNHTIKAGAEANISNFIYIQDATASGQFYFSPGETSLPYLAPATTINGATPGFTYASFLLGAVDNGQIGVATDQHLDQNTFALFIQDSWKVTRKFTLDYGLRWDYLTYLREGAGRMPSFSPSTLNPSAGNLPGATIFEGSGGGRCNCNFAHNYPYAIGPRLGGAYQITPKTVLRAGIGVVYAPTAAYDNLTISSNNPFVSPGLFQPAMYLQNGVPITPTPWPNFDPGQFPNVPGQIGTAPSLIDPNAGRPPRQLQWSAGIQREVLPNLLVEASYVGNRGAWWPANGLAVYNALTPQILAANGLSLDNANDLKLLASPLSSALAAQRGFNTPPYAGFPLSSTVAQALRPYPQFGNISGMYAPLGDTWYDSLQVKVTKRLSHGLDASYSLTWQKSLTLGSESEGSGAGAAINDAFNRQIDKYISEYDQPLVSIIAVNYIVPRWGIGSSFASKTLSWIGRDWTVGALLQYRSGMPIQSPTSSTNLATYLFQSTFMDRVPGVPLFTQDLNCHCFDPQTTFVLNPKAWTNPPLGQFGTAAAYYSDYRYQRRPTENVSLGRTFRITERASLNIRAEFTNIFNRTEFNNPSASSATATQTRSAATGRTTGGFGFINTGTTFALPRQGQLVARFRF